LRINSLLFGDMFDAVEVLALDLAHPMIGARAMPVFEVHHVTLALSLRGYEPRLAFVWYIHQ
jgi:hypothetical protein